MHVEEPSWCTCPPLSHVHAPIGTEPHFSPGKIDVPDADSNPKLRNLPGGRPQRINGAGRTPEADSR